MKTRRAKTVWLAGAAAIMPATVIAASHHAFATTPETRFQPPAAAMLLTRTLHRPLPGGAYVKTRRCYEIHFVADGKGYRIEGTLVDVEVDAPPSLTALATLERARTDDSMFPMHVDENGLLTPEPAAAPEPSTVEARRYTAGALQRIGLAEEEKRDAESFVSQFKAQSGRTPWPRNLFNPTPGQHLETRNIPLASGALGTVSIAIEAQLRKGSALLSSLSRTVTTDLGDDSRVVRETWTLSDKM